MGKLAQHTCQLAQRPKIYKFKFRYKRANLKCGNGNIYVHQSFNVRLYMSSRWHQSSVYLNGQTTSGYPGITRIKDSKDTSTFRIHLTAMLLFSAASLSFFTGYGSAHLHNLHSGRNLYRNCICYIDIENCIKTRQYKTRSPYIDLDI